MDFTRKKVVVTGGNGFLGKAVVAELVRRGVSNVLVARKRDYDLRHRSEVQRLYSDTRPEVLIHLAATVGGIGANRDNPGRFFYENMAMGLHIIEEGRSYGSLDKLVIVGTTCSYPKHTTTPFCECDLWNGYPEETNAPYGIAKRALLVMGLGYREQYGLNNIYLIPANLYGPGDNFDPKTSHVIPALIRKFVRARETDSPSVDVWGTGEVSREFLYVEDAAEGVVLATLHYDGSDPINLGTGSEIYIRDLVNEIKELVQYQGKIIWDRSQPDGQPRRRLDVTRAFREFGFSAKTELRSGLRKTLMWYLRSRTPETNLASSSQDSHSEAVGGSDIQSS